MSCCLNPRLTVEVQLGLPVQVVKCGPVESLHSTGSALRHKKTFAVGIECASDDLVDDLTVKAKVSGAVVAGYKCSDVVAVVVTMAPAHGELQLLESISEWRTGK
jgi:hypothetical protein